MYTTKMEAMFSSMHFHMTFKIRRVTKAEVTQSCSNVF